MSVIDCRGISEMLVEYVDGELSIDDHQLVAEHLGSCLACQSARARLVKSLECACSIWDMPDATMAPIEAGRPWRLSMVRAAAVLAATLLIGLILWAPVARLDQPSERQISNRIKQAATHAAAAQPSLPSRLQLEQQISRASMAAQLEASSVLLASDPSLREYRERNDRLLATQFADFAAGRNAQSRLRDNN